jgi:hypothetical protein
VRWGAGRGGQGEGGTEGEGARRGGGGGREGGEGAVGGLRGDVEHEVQQVCMGLRRGRGGRGGERGGGGGRGEGACGVKKSRNSWQWGAFFGDVEHEVQQLCRHVCGCTRGEGGGGRACFR